MKVSLQFQEEKEEIALKNQAKFGADSEQYPRKFDILADIVPILW